MSRYIILTTEGYTEAPDESNSNNCQVLGWSDGETSQQAIARLFANGQYEDAGWNMARCTAHRLAE